MPLVSVIMPAFDSARFIAEAIRSVQAQTFGDWELVIVDDASADSTPEIITRFSDDDSRIRYFRMDRNSGAGASRQKALDLATGRYIAFLDADDLWTPDKLEKQLRFMEKSGQPFSFSSYELMNESGTKTGKRVEAPDPLSYRKLFFCNFVGNLTGMYDSGYFGKIPISVIRKRQDWMVWLTVMKQLKKATPITESLAVYRVREDSLSSSKWRMLKYNYVVYRKFHGFNTLKSLLCMAIFLFMQLVIKPRYVRSITKEN